VHLRDAPQVDGRPRVPVPKLNSLPHATFRISRVQEAGDLSDQTAKRPLGPQAHSKHFFDKEMPVLSAPAGMWARGQIMTPLHPCHGFDLPS
jgi:hypothetical protein